MATKATRPKGAKPKSGRDSGEHYKKALEAFERAVKAMYKGDAAKAHEQFVALIKSYPEEKELLDRARSYAIACEQKTAPQRRLKTAEEHMTAGVASLNDEDLEQAIKHLSKAAELEPSNAHVHYCLAAAHAASGDAKQTAKHLTQAISGDPSTRIHARADEDFASVRNSDEVAPLLVGA